MGRELDIRKLLGLYKEYVHMRPEEREEMNASKCEYYQEYVKVSMLGGCLLSISYIVSDYFLNGNTIWPTFGPRFSIIFFAIVYLLLEKKAKSQRVIFWLDAFLCLAVQWCTIGAIYHLDDKTHAVEGFVVMSLMLLTIGYISTPIQGVCLYAVFLLDILISHWLVHYTNIEVIMAIQIPCVAAVLMSQIFLTLTYLDHFKLTKKLEYNRLTDQLTKVYNRRKLEELVQENQILGMQEPICVAMMDIDYFKKVNDEYGHYVGDQTLAYLGRCLSQSVAGKNDYVIRYGGEEFVVLMSNCDMDYAKERIEELRKDIHHDKSAPVPFTISAGVAAYDGDFTSTIIRVDKRLYRAKENGRNQVVAV